MHLRPSAVLAAAYLLHSGGEIDDALNVLERLGRQPDHEVQLDVGPAVSEGRLRRCKRSSSVVVLLMTVAETLATRLRGKSNVVLALTAGGGSDADGEAIDTQAGQGDG